MFCNNHCFLLGCTPFSARQETSTRCVFDMISSSAQNNRIFLVLYISRSFHVVPRGCPERPCIHAEPKIFPGPSS